MLQSQALRDRSLATPALMAALLMFAAVAATVAQAEDKLDFKFFPSIDIPTTQEVRLLTADGREILGRVHDTATSAKGVSRVTIIGPDGSKQKFKAEEVERLIVPLDPVTLARTILWMPAGGRKNADRDPPEVLKELVFHSVAAPGSSKHRLLLQVNPGFDHTFRVYAPRGNRISRVGPFTYSDLPTEVSTYLVVKRQGAPAEMRKGKYRGLFASLFGDCPEMLARYPKKDRDFSDFANHIAHYDRLCTLTAYDGSSSTR